MKSIDQATRRYFSIEAVTDEAAISDTGDGHLAEVP
jgi:hypothetical protein